MLEYSTNPLFTCLKIEKLLHDFNFHITHNRVLLTLPSKLKILIICQLKIDLKYNHLVVKGSWNTFSPKEYRNTKC